ncbi:trypsin eta [Drosophila sulfurigaster albostrigata]|uniref:trypsin eta n=1 Tax=Drosophila sulfurigaster albostrigata TaxID=89887 RepID=UPI002D219D60|nr:trypsin eta [Drosophila sulfurigaster albostrigata]
MHLHRVCTALLWVFLNWQVNAQIDAGKTLMIEETVHRPTYYNKAHKSSAHVDYNPQLLALRDAKPKREPRVALPSFDPKTDLSYYVNVLDRGSVICAGALISRRMVVTSSRCFLPQPTEPTREFKAEDMSVVTGKDFADGAHKTSQVIAFYMPVEKEAGKGVHNIALLALEQKLQRGAYRYIPLYSRLPPKGTPVTMSFVDHQSHDITLYESKVLSNESCKQTYEDYGKIRLPFNEEFFCVANRKKAGCSTRPGDPLIIENKLAGINLYGELCDELKEGRKADVYYSLRHSVPFIQRSTDLLRAFTKSGPYNSSATTPRTTLYP